MNEKTNQTRYLVINGFIISIFIIFTLVPFLGYINLGIFKLTIMHLLFLIALETWAIIKIKSLFLAGLFYGLAFGISSWVQAILFPSATSFIFINPLFSILPRLLMGFSMGLVSYFFHKIDLNINAKSVSNNKRNSTNLIFNKSYHSVIGFLCATLNTFFVLLFIYLLGPLIFHSSAEQKFFHAFTFMVLVTNYLPEAILATILFPIFARVIKKLV